MYERNVDALPAEAFSRGVKVLKPRNQAKHVVILGFDTEYDSVTKEIVCYQLSDGERSALVEATEDFTWAQLAKWCRGCLVEWGYSLRDCVTIMLVSHFSTAELSHIKDFYKHALIRRVSPQQVYNATYRINKHQRLYLMDQYHFFNTGLAKVAETFGEAKMEYDTTQVSRASLRDPKFKEYAVWDAVVCARIFAKFRQRLLDDHSIDVVHYPTPASLAMAVYRRHWIRYDLDAPDPRVRRQAWLSLWGGRAEAYVQGDLFGGFTLNDVKSLYPTSVRVLGVLPRANDWVMREEPQQWRGLCRVRFRFPSDAPYPCLPMYHDGRLIFALEGVSDCTLQEAAAARDMGADLRFLTVLEYDGGDPSLNKYMEHFIAEKDRAEEAGDKVGRELSKLMMNALIGKFSQNRGDVDIEDMKKFCDEEGIPLEVALNPAFLHPLKPRAGPRIGGNIMPEWSALILGNARAIIARLSDAVAKEATAMGVPLSNLITSTDSVLNPAELNDVVQAVSARLGIRMDSKNKRPARHVRIVRSRVYAGADEAGEILFGAAHAVHLPQRGVRGCAACDAGECKDVRHSSLRFIMSDEDTYSKTQRLGLKSAIRTGRRFFDDVHVPTMRFSRLWDNKRRLLPGSAEGSRPWRNTEEYESVVHPGAPGGKVDTAGRRTRV